MPRRYDHEGAARILLIGSRELFRQEKVHVGRTAQGWARRRERRRWCPEPVVAAVLHNASSVAVVANSSRLIRYRLAR